MRINACKYFYKSINTLRKKVIRHIHYNLSDFLSDEQSDDSDEE